MAEYKSPFTPWVSDIWNDVIVENGDTLSLEEKVKIMGELYQKIFVDGKWLVGIADAGLIGYQNARLALEQENWAQSKKFLSELLSHPDANSTDSSILYAVILDGVLDIYFGDFKLGSDKILSLSVLPEDRKLKFLIARNILGSFCVHYFGTGPADKHVIALARVIVSEILTNPVTDTLTESATYPEVIELLQSTYVE
jgi:hypothetical protein